jgi:cell division protease FtsH
MKPFEAIIGYEDIKIELERVLDTIINNEKYEALGVKVPAGILLHGAPGVGKTLFATTFLKNSGRPYFVCRKDRPDGEFVNEIKNVFEKAKEAAPSIVLLDDIDKFANATRRYSNDEEFVTVQSCIDEIKHEGKTVFVFATANEIDKLPESLTRSGRFDKIIEMNVPMTADAAKIIKHYLSNKPVEKDLDFQELARILKGYSCSDLETIINEAGIYSGFEGRNLITKADILRAIMRIIFKAPEKLEAKNDKYEYNVAVHEAGHALVNELLASGSVNLVSINRHAGGIEGITSYFQDENYWEDMKYMENRVMALLGGRAATEMKLGIVDVGVSSDMRRAYDIVARFVDNYCIHGFDKLERRNPSTALLERKGMFIQSELDRYYLKVKRMIVENMDFLDKIVNALVEKKTITSADIQALKSA